MSLNAYHALASEVVKSIEDENLDIEMSANRIHEECDKRNLLKKERIIVDMVISFLRERGHNRFANLFGKKYSLSGKQSPFGGDRSEEKDLIDWEINPTPIDRLLRENKFASVLKILHQKERDKWDGYDYVLATKSMAHFDIQLALDFISEAEWRKIPDPEYRLAELKATVLSNLGKIDDAISVLDKVPKHLWTSFMYSRAIKITMRKNNPYEAISKYAEEAMQAFPGHSIIFCEYLKICAKYSWNPMSFIAKYGNNVVITPKLLLCMANCCAKKIISRDFFNIIIESCPNISKKMLKRAILMSHVEFLENDELRKGNDSRSDFFEAGRIHNLQPIDRNAYRIAYNQPSPRERNGTFHDPKSKRS